jgi:outer membrane immunogenic protein
MKRVLFGSMALIALGVSAPAVAADMPVKAAPPPPVVYDWSGAYVGFNIGGIWADIERTHVYPAPFQNEYTTSNDDAIYGFHAGFQQQWGIWVLGIEAAYSACFHECNGTVGPLGPPFAADLAHYNKITNLFTVGPRLGWAWDRWMFFVTGGYAVASLKGQYVVNSTGLQVFPTFSGQSWNDGWFAGAGIEYMVYKGPLVDVILGAEYQHIDLRDKRAFTEAPPIGGFDDSFNLKATADIVRARLTIKTQGWGWSGPWATAPVAAKY